MVETNKETVQKSSKKLAKKPPIPKFREIVKKPIFKQRLAINMIVLTIAIAIAVIFADFRGYWALISAIAVLVCEDFAKIPERGVLRIVGAFAGYFLGSLIATIDFGVIGAIIFLIVGTFLVSRFLPTDKYALGSAGIGLVAVAVASLTEGAIGWHLLWERLFWTVVGAVVVIVVVFVSNRIWFKKHPSLASAEMQKQ